MMIIIIVVVEGFKVGRACVPGLKQKRGVEGGVGGAEPPPICKW